MDKKIKEDELEELKKILETGDEEYKKPVSIIHDGVQYSVRIPAKFADILRINPKKDKFEFEIIIPSDKTKEPSLNGRFVRG